MRGGVRVDLGVSGAAGLREHADLVEGQLGNPAFGSDEYLRGRGSALRGQADALVSVLKR